MAWRYANFNELWEPKNTNTTQKTQEINEMTQKAQPAIADIEWDIIEGENSDFAVQFPRLQWVHGEAKASGFMKSGGLFINKEQYPNFEGEGFTPAVLITQDGKEIDGYGASSANLAVVRIKHQWVKSDEGKNVPLSHVLCVVKGCDDLLLLSLKGPSKALEFQKAFNQHIAQPVSVANRTRPPGSPQLEPFALWFNVKASAPVSAQSKDGKSKSNVTPPVLVSPEQVDRDYAVSLWVGKENYKQFAAFWKDNAKWQTVKILESHDEEANDTPTHTGYAPSDADPATEEQLEHLINVATAKGQNLAELMLEYTNGGTNKIENLSKGEAREFINRLAAM